MKVPKYVWWCKIIEEDAIVSNIIDNYRDCAFYEKEKCTWDIDKKPCNAVKYKLVRCKMMNDRELEKIMQEFDKHFKGNEDKYFTFDQVRVIVEKTVKRTLRRSRV